jgi:hypothetical protein
MRLWSLHPKYLDTKGLVALWREGLLALSVLQKGKYHSCSDCDGNGRYQHSINNMIECPKCKGNQKLKTAYYNHPQLDRWKIKPIESLKNYLYCIWEEAEKRGYNFNVSKIKLEHDDWIVDCPHDEYFMTVTKGQIAFEMKHLYKKLEQRSKQKYNELHDLFFGNIEGFIDFNKIQAHPLFRVIDGEIEKWEKINGNE